VVGRGYQLSVIGYWLLVVSYQLSVIGYQLLVIGDWGSELGEREKGVLGWMITARPCSGCRSPFVLGKHNNSRSQTAFGRRNTEWLGIERSESCH
jgi:hypothetical protein